VPTGRLLRQGVRRRVAAQAPSANTVLAAVMTNARAAANGALRLASASCQTSMPVVKTFLPPSSVAET
jgi:hypothetical protein